ncbi:MAG: hypothetical protein LIO40_06270 [Ruminococcus sp.]|nr:hypothetical protein [Ruminococcus sp.]
MLLEQEIASIMAFALKYADNPRPYYYNVPESFQYPAMYFPQPEISTGGETFRTYAMRYAWYIKIFCDTTENAYEQAWKVLTALKRQRNLVPLIDEDGEYIAGCGNKLRLDDPSIKTIDTGAAQITLTWTSRRPYAYDEAEKMTEWEVSGSTHPDIYNTVRIETAYDAAVQIVTANYPEPEYAGEAP